MFFTILNNYQRTVASSCILILGIVQIVVDGWTLFKIQQHEELILFLSGNAIPSNVMHYMTYDQALSYFSKLKQFLSPDLLEILDILQMAVVLGLVAGILQLFSSTATFMSEGRTVDICWLVANFIVSILLCVAVSYISIYMIGDVAYHQVLLTVTAVNLFVLIHIWIVNLTALIHRTCFDGSQSSSRGQLAETETQPSPVQSSDSDRATRTNNTATRP